MITEKLRHEICEMLSLERKPIIEGWTNQEKAEVLASLVIDHKPQLLVEIGVFGGRSVFAQAFALRENGMGTIWGIDPWSLDAALEGDIGEENRKWWTENVKLDDIYIGFMRGVLDMHLTQYIRWIRERGEVAAKLFNKASIDILHLDSNHSELCSSRDVGIWHNKVKPGGFFVMDDTDWPTQAKALKTLSDWGYEPVHKSATFIVYKKPQ